MSGRAWITAGVLGTLAAGGAALAGSGPTLVSSSEAMREAAAAFVATLDPGTLERATYAFEDPERFNWGFVPRERNGLPLGDMTRAQRDAATALLRVALSEDGFRKVEGVRTLEGVLRELEGSPRRDPEAYFVTIFGAPSADEPWGWRFEGHHLSVNYTSVTDELVATTPTFLGANPARVAEGPHAGLRLLGAEEDLARALLASLDEVQRARAIIAGTAPRDIITGDDRRVGLVEVEGLPAAEMTPAQKEALRRLMREYIGNMAPALAAAQVRKIEEADFERLHFAWAGSTEPGEGHYYRIHGPTVLIEYDNTQGGANHVHSVWRDLTDDFGEDVLRRHYDRAGPDHGH